MMMTHLDIFGIPAYGQSARLEEVAAGGLLLVREKRTGFTLLRRALFLDWPVISSLV